MILSMLSEFKKIGRRDAYNTKLINNDILKSMSGTVCSAIDSSKKSVLPENGPMWLKHVAK
jgi:hypothetical protein